VEAKKPTRHKQRQPTLSVPQRGRATPSRIRSPRHTAPGDSTNISAPRPQAGATKTIHINVSFSSFSQSPGFQKIIARVRHLLSTKKAVSIVSIAVVVIVGSLVVGSSIRQHNLANKTASNDPNKIVENLEYQTVLPSGESISALGGWKRVSPPGSGPVYAYIDAIDGIAISVSQQPLPKSFEGHSDSQVAELAKKFNATTKIDASGTTVYLGTSAKGPQSVILTKNGLLILIKSQGKIEDSSWATYATALN